MIFGRKNQKIPNEERIEQINNILDSYKDRETANLIDVREVIFLCEELELRTRLKKINEELRARGEEVEYE